MKTSIIFRRLIFYCCCFICSGFLNKAFADQNFNLSQEQLNHFNEEGYVLIKSLFNLEEISEVRTCLLQALEEVKETAEQTSMNKNIKKGTSFRFDYNGKGGCSSSVKVISTDGLSLSIQLISWIGGIKEELLDISRTQKLIIPVSQLLRSATADHLINQVHYKLPFDGVSFPWHQDIQHRRAFDPQWEDINRIGSFVQVLTAVDSMTKDNGPIIIVRGSHKKDLHLEQQQKDMIERIIIEEYPNKEYIPICMEPGDTMFMHPLLLHKSDPNISNKSRMVLVNGFSYPGANKMPYPGLGSAKTIQLLTL